MTADAAIDAALDIQLVSDRARLASLPDAVARKAVLAWSSDPEDRGEYELTADLGGGLVETICVSGDQIGDAATVAELFEDRGWLVDPASA